MRIQLAHFTAVLLALAIDWSSLSAAPPNVLFIAEDDLRPQLGCYDSREMITPHIDRPASRGMVFNRAYCQAAVCRASRSSLLLGVRPDTTEIWSNESQVESEHEYAKGDPFDRRSVVHVLPAHLRR
jgi:arylsulfatase A-like enzyme